MDRDLLYYHACIAAFIEGTKVSERLIIDGQYAKATAALKQDYELRTRIHEFRAAHAKACNRTRHGRSLAG